MNSSTSPCRAAVTESVAHEAKSLVREGEHTVNVHQQESTDTEQLSVQRSVGERHQAQNHNPRWNHSTSALKANVLISLVGSAETNIVLSHTTAPQPSGLQSTSAEVKRGSWFFFIKMHYFKSKKDIVSSQPMFDTAANLKGRGNEIALDRLGAEYWTNLPKSVSYKSLTRSMM